MKNKRALILILTIIILTIFCGVTYAYITSQIEAYGVFNVSISNANVRISKNQMNDGKLNIELENCGEEEQYVRVKMIISDNISLKSTSIYWTLNEGYWYYNSVLEPGEKSSILQLEINTSDIETKDYKIITNVESTNVMYDENGNMYTDWQFTYNN